MARHKKSSGRGSRNPNRQETSARPTTRSTANKDFQELTFTLRDAARNSGHPSSYFSSATLHLRHQAMNFVRSTEPLEQDLAHIQTQPPDSKNVQQLENPSDVENAPPQPHHSQMTQVSDVATSPAHEPEVKPMPQKSSPIPPRSPTPSSSEDEVVFVGRNRLNEPQQSSIESPAPTLRDSSKAPTSNFVPPSTSPVPNNHDAADLWEDVSDEPIESADRARIHSKRAFQLARKGSGKRKRPSRRPASAATDAMMEELLDDYVANMRANGEISDVAELATQPVEQAAVKAVRNGWTSEDMQDFDDLSTSHEVLEAVQEILSKRQRPSGVQYLVVWKGQSVDEARWISVSALTMPGAAALIQAFEEEEKHVMEYLKNDSSGDEDDIHDDDQIKWESDSADSELEEALDDILDEEDLIERKIARMTDEHLARLLQKQDSLGIFSDELQIFDGSDEDDLVVGPGYIDPAARRVTSRKKRDRARRRRDAEDLFAMEEELMLGGDDYGDFDVMDFERPSLQRSGKNQSDPLQDLSDSDIAQNLREAWAQDRKKKGAKKQEREELRSQGLLGKKNSKDRPDLKAKYKNGMSLDQLVDELEDFICNGQREELSLPPMAKHERKAIHEVARPFGLTTKSQGSNKQRFTILFKTSRTYGMDLTDADFDRLKRQLGRKFLPRMDQKGKGLLSGAGRARAGPGGGKYRDGEIVGAEAPELASDNRGRAMLEKMGWSSGTALGALNNQGILKPIEHVVKNSRAGLG